MRSAASRSVDAARPQFSVLWRAFFAQFFTSETVSSDVQLRNVMMGVIAFLLVPGILLIVELFFDYQGLVIRAIRYQQFDRVTDALEWIEFVFVTYSMVTIGFIAVFEWDALGFDRRDAMVLGPLPVAGTVAVAAKLAALAALLLGAALAVNLPDAFVFAFATADRLGAVALLRHFSGHLIATVAAAAFTFAALVVARGLAGLAAGPRLAAALGTLLQFLFVVALLALVILSPYVIRLPHPELVNPTVTGWLPPAWFMAVFEWVRGSPRAWIVALSSRAAFGMPAALASALIVSAAGYRREMRRALSPAATAGAIGRARVLRSLARLVAGRSGGAGAISDFVLFTLIRTRSQQAVIAVNVAAGVAVALAGLATRRGGLASLAAPRTAVLWIPLVITYATAVGLRASCFVPSELNAAWTFRANGPEDGPDYRAGTRAATTAVLASVAVLTSVALAPVVGWHVTVWHTAVTLAVAVMLSEGLTLTIDFIPFTRPYEPGHARLRTRWPLYVIGLFVFAYLPSRFEVRFLPVPSRLTIFAAVLGALAAGLHIVGERRREWSSKADAEMTNEFYRVTVLDI